MQQHDLRWYFFAGYLRKHLTFHVRNVIFMKLIANLCCMIAILIVKN